MIYLNLENKKIRMQNHDDICNDSILSFLNNEISFSGKKDVNLFNVLSLVEEYPNLYLVFPGIKNIKEKVDMIINENKDKSFSGKIFISETYEVSPVISGADYMKDISTFIKIDKKYKIFYENNNGDRQLLRKTPLKYFSFTKMYVQNEIISFVKMRNDLEIIKNVDFPITLNDFLLVLSYLEYNE